VIRADGGGVAFDLDTVKLLMSMFVSLFFVTVPFGRVFTDHPSR
jgi:hypothetical protein